MNDFEHERLDVYRASIEFFVITDEISAGLPKGRAYLSDQLRRAYLFSGYFLTGFREVVCIADN